MVGLQLKAAAITGVDPLMFSSFTFGVSSASARGWEESQSGVGASRYTQIEGCALGVQPERRDSGGGVTVTCTWSDMTDCMHVCIH